MAQRYIICQLLRQRCIYLLICYDTAVYTLSTVMGQRYVACQRLGHSGIYLSSVMTQLYIAVKSYMTAVNGLSTVMAQRYIAWHLLCHSGK